MTEELAHENGFEVDVQGYEDAFKEHQKNRRQARNRNSTAGLRTIPKKPQNSTPQRTFYIPLL